MTVSDAASLDELGAAIRRGTIGLWPSAVPPPPGSVRRPLAEPMSAPLQVDVPRHPSPEARDLVDLADHLAAATSAMSAALGQQPQSGSQ